jgi:protein-S-isoprenylcysteine O-methyltransferase Ste14
MGWCHFQLYTDRRAVVLSRARSILLFFEAVVFTIFVPGTVTVWIPNLILSPAERVRPEPWALPQFVAVVLITIGTAIYLRCLWEFAARGRGIPAPIDHPKQLVVTGLYQYVRNPMYLGVFTVLAGEVLLFQSSSLLIFAIGFFVFIHLNVIF